MAGRNDNRIPILVLAVACVAASALVASPRVCLAQESGSTITGLDSGTSDFGGSSVNFAADASSVKALKLNPTHPPSKGGAGALSSIYARNTAEARAIIAQALRSSREPVKPADSAVAKGLVEDMASGDTSRKETAEHRLTELGESAITPLVQMAKGDQPPAQRTATLKLLTLIGPAAAGPMATLLRHPSKDVRREVAEALAAMGDRLCLDPLCAAATDTDSDVRMAAVNGLGRLHQTMAAIVLGKMLAKEPVIEIRIAAAKSLGQVGSRAAIEPLIDARADPRAPGLGPRPDVHVRRAGDGHARSDRVYQGVRRPAHRARRQGRHRPRDRGGGARHAQGSPGRRRTGRPVEGSRGPPGGHQGAHPHWRRRSTGTARKVRRRSAG
jgi:hypothetical protein